MDHSCVVNRTGVDPVIFGMCAEKLDVSGAMLVADRNDQSVTVAAMGLVVKFSCP